MKIGRAPQHGRFSFAAPVIFEYFCIMVYDLEFLQQRFGEFNQQMFGGRLPAAPFELIRVKTFLGECRMAVTTYPDGRRVSHSFKLRFSTFYDLPERVLEDTLIHEMIHYFIAYNGLADTAVHGIVFKSIMQGINEKHGRAVAIRHHMTRGQAVTTPPPAKERKQVRFLAVIQLTDGRCVVKALPRKTDAIIAFNGRLASAGNVGSVEFYMHDDPYFHRFPVSTSLRVSLVDGDELQRRLAGAVRYEISGNQVRPKQA